MRRIVLSVAVVALLLLCGYTAAATSRWYDGEDLFCLWSGSRILATGGDPYDAHTWIAATGAPHGRGGAPSSCVQSYAYPLWTAVVLLPFGALPLEAASVLWMALAVGGTVAGTKLAWHAYAGAARTAPLLAVVVVSSQPFWILLVRGQTSGLLLALAGVGTWLLATRRAPAAGVAFALLALKPQIGATVLPLVAAFARDRRIGLAAGGAVALAVLVAVSLLARPDWISGWVHDVTQRRSQYVLLLATVWGLADDIFGSAAWGAVLVAILAAALILLLRGRRLDAADAVAVVIPVSLFIAPHLWSYDHLLLAVSWAFILARASRAPARRRAALAGAIAIVAALIPWVLYAVAFGRRYEALSAIVPALTALLVAVTHATTRSGAVTTYSGAEGEVAGRSRRRGAAL